MNIFQDTYDNRIRSWRDLRTSTKTLPIDQACIEIDRWWQQAPLVKHHLHWNDTQNWPSPWEMLSENEYCLLTRTIGMCYTLLLVGIKDVRLVIASDNQAEEHYLVLVDGAKYTLSYWPDSVIITSSEEFTIIRDLSLDSILHKIK